MNRIELCWLLLVLTCPVIRVSIHAAEEPDALPALVQVLKETDDPQFQSDILKGMSDGLKGRPRVLMPKDWETVEAKLGQSPSAEVRFLAQMLSVTFGSAKARAALRQTLLDPAADLAARRAALESLQTVREPGWPAILRDLLRDPNLRGSALRSLAAYDDPQTPSAILGVYSSLGIAEKRDALTALAARAAFAKPLLEAVARGAVPAKDLTADVIRQLRNLKNSEIDRQIQKAWGTARDSSADKQDEIAKYKRIYRAGGSQPGDATRGRAVFARACQQCHTLFGAGGKVGPDLTGSNRSDLDYILQNIIDPNAVIPNDYRASTVETKDNRVITGIVKHQDASAVTVVTANETLVLPRPEIDSLQQSELSMMPEGLLQPFLDQEMRDLIYYLSRPGQVPLVATPETVDLFFNGKDLTGWDGDPDLWKFENGEIVGRSAAGLKQDEFLNSDLVLGDFRLICQVKLRPNKEKCGIQFRTEVMPGGEAKGYQAAAGAGRWGKLFEERGRGLLSQKSGENYLKAEDWNTYEIVAVGSRIRTAINGQPCVDLEDPAGAKRGIVAFQLAAGGPVEVRCKDFRLELNPKPELTTAKP